ncbi:two-component system sensor histidine kinase ComP [Paenibacillus cellulosilyticus]|uniref:histidine kinase n=1 Tax=Paenibacillus cellulosilyticus TaxID=375489 RepID=A0A2V2YUR9_9BACL|nr:ATP-binding protein [Paenibacillus cellulosilyticus]PWW02762.1 two-component system sensor histidine kinase ComP [Paenibacillus cellulosilyticus]QKS45684.1 PDZ domain-containing protein [Paenibacillus cellulosilyticus]
MVNTRYKNWAFLLFTLVIAGWSIVLYFRIPYMGVDLHKSNGEWIVADVDPKAWAVQEGIAPGDIVTHVDHQPVEGKNLWDGYGINTSTSITVMRSGHPIELDFSDRSERPIQWNVYFIPMSLFVVMLTISLFIAYKKPEDRSASLLILFLMSVALGYLAGYGNTVGNMIFAIVFMLALTFAPILFLHFVVSYFNNKGIVSVHKQVVTIGYGAVVAWNILYLFFIPISNSDQQTWLLMKAFGFIVFIIGTLIALLVQVRMYVRYRNTTRQALMIYMMVGNIASFFPFICLTLLPILLVGTSIVDGSIAGLSFLFLPITYLYLIVSNQLFDIEFIISRLRYYLIMALLPSLIFLAGLELVFIDTSIQLIVWGRLCLVIYGLSILFLYVREVLDRKLRNKVIKGAHEFEQSLESFSNRVSEVKKVSELEQCVQKELLDLLPIDSVGFIECSNEDQEIKLKRTHGNVPFEELYSQLHHNWSSLRVGKELKLTKGICYKIGQGSETHHLVWISDKVNHTEFNHDEKMWLRTLITHVGFVYQNLQLIEGLVQDLDLKREEAPPWVLRLLFRLSEQERRKLASDLHDSALQDQLVWYRKLEMIVSDEAELPTNTRSQLNEISEGLLDVIHQIRETCNELRPPFLQEMGAIQAIENLCSHAQLNANFTITFDHQDFRVELGDEYVLAIYRITQELLRNGMKHSKATHVNLQLYYEGRNIHYCYKDNGVGIEMDRLQLSFDHMGLAGIRERVSGLEGETVLRTAPGKGLEIDILLPLPVEDKDNVRRTTDNRTRPIMIFPHSAEL